MIYNICPTVGFWLRLFDSVFWLMKISGCARVSLCGFHAVTMLGCAVLRVFQHYSFISVSLISFLPSDGWHGDGPSTDESKKKRQKERDCTFQSPPLLSCRGKVWLSQLEYINKSAFSFPFKQVPSLPDTWFVCSLYIIEVQWLIGSNSDWLCKAALMTFDCMWCFKISR